ncbi:hypothetical protein HRbin33_02290 [bacterium HR33]|nr:hypothetical protein HRbin33_02290 [bacterium HR33]
MALVRCPKHDIPYSDENPRGCPACALEREKPEQASVMRELARASRALRTGTPTQVPKRPSVEIITPITPPPKAPEVKPTMLERLRWQVRRRPIQAIGIPLILVLLGLLVFRSRPKFVEQPHPALFSGEVLPLPIEPGQPITAVFAILGTQPPRPHPEARVLERYYYGADLVIDALNRVVYSIDLRVPSRSWKGLRVGMNRQNAEGALALLGVPRETSAPESARADTVGGYVVYPSLEDRPRQSLKVEVRPPNGCFDVAVDLQPRVVGLVRDARREYAAVGPPGAPLDWVVTRITVTSRAMPGPAGPAAC